MRKCRKCQEKIPNWVTIDEKRRNLQNRKFCLSCSPFGSHNTKSDVDGTKSKKKYKDLTKEQRKAYNDMQWQRQKLLRKKRKALFVEQKGGCCKICGYKKNLASLNFHHIDPSRKEFTLSSRELACFSLKRLQEEVNKCDLLCSNCHMEHHYPELNDW